MRFTFIQNEIINWGKKNLRNYPWRETNNIYEIIIAEILLHRTKANQVLEIYNKFKMTFFGKTI